MNYYIGTQFQDDTNQNIDPVLLETTNDSQNFANNVAMAAESQALTQPPAMTFAEIPLTPPRTLNPEAVPYQPRVQQASPYSNQPLEDVPGLAGPAYPEPPQWHSEITLRTPPHQTRPPPLTNFPWQQHDPNAALSPDWVEAPLPPQQPDPMQWTPQPYYHQENSYLTPPYTAHYHDRTNGNAFGGRDFSSVPFPPPLDSTMTTPARDNHMNLSWMNVATLSTEVHSSDRVNSWNAQSYTAGDRTRESRCSSLAPPTPTSIRNGRGRPRGSTNSSISAATNFTCDTCERTFTKKHELDHHRRIHGKRNHACTLCSSTFIFRKDLVRHMTSHNKEERHIFCNVMGCKFHQKGFGRLDHWKRHMEKKHPGLPTPNSSVCGGG